MNILIVGCGRLGMRLAHIANKDGHHVIGVRREQSETAAVPIQMLAADASRDHGIKLIAQQCAHPDIICVCANPGLRGGGDNQLNRMADLLLEQFPQTRILYTSSTAVYPDAPGRLMHELSDLDADTARAQRLSQIEQQFLTCGHAWVFRLSALVGPERSHLRKRIQEAIQHKQALKLRGPVGRRFNFVHEYDAADILYTCIKHSWSHGVYNLSSDIVLSLLDYVHQLQDDLGCDLEIVETVPSMPDRIIDCSKLLEYLGSYEWRTALANS